MKKFIIAFEVLLLLVLITATILYVVPKLDPQEETTTQLPPVTVEREHDPFKAYRLEGFTSDTVFTYFSEIAHNAEYAGDNSIHNLIQKWDEPIRYRIYGECTDEDLSVLTGLFTEINTIPHFPGICEAEPGDEENLSIYFLDRNLFNISFGDTINQETADGASETWFYTDTCKIYSGRIGYVTDVPQAQRNSILVEEVINVLGLSDSELRTDSIVYQHSDDNLQPSDMDWLILKLLYHPLIECGMTQEETGSTALFDY